MSDYSYYEQHHHHYYYYSFYSIYAISVKLSPEQHSKGIQCLEAQTFNFHCLQTKTGNGL